MRQLLPLLLLTPLASAAEPDAKGVEFFEKKIRPVLVEHCTKCHSADAKKTKGNLNLDSRAGLIDGGDSGPAINAKDTAKSLLLKALRHDGLKMPSEATKLPDAVIADFETWVKMGAPDPRDGKSAVNKGIDIAEARKHWAYQPVKVAKPPAVKDSAWAASDLDRFVLARIEARGFAPAPDAAKHAWVRRVTFDLTGLPPTPEEVNAFLDDGNREKVVDRLLASPRFGEHWARHWLDGVRFDIGTQTIERYRDWVVRAFNADMPYDRFVTLQLAGDLLPPSADAKEQADRIFATQMLALNLGEMDSVEGMIEVFGQQILGVSINCAKCHDHKFDAYSQTDYYALAGVFTGSAIAGNKGPAQGGVEVPGEAGVKILAIADNPKLIGDTQLLIRGEKNQKGPTVSRRFPAVLAGDDQTPLGRSTKQSGRLELAKWATDPANPLTARVMANRIWQRMFGRGIVRTPNDFGLAGEAPGNPELLDHMAASFTANGWSVKKLIREIALSRAYRQGTSNAAASQADPENALFARAEIRRLSYEQLVDSLNSAGCILKFEIPTRVKNNDALPRFGGGKEVPTAASRALYHNDATVRVMFDGANPDLLTEKREQSVTAPQMLFFLNNPAVISLSGKLAKRAETLAGSGERVAGVYKILFARAPSEAEAIASKAFLAKNSFERFCQVLLCSSEFLYLE